MGSGGLARVKATPAQVDLLKVSTFTSFRSFLEMGNSRSQLQLQEEEINEITAETGFTKQQIERLYARFTSLDKQNHGYLTREDFLRIPELAINPLGDRIVHAFFYESKSQGEEKVDFKDFVRVVAHFRPDRSRDHCIILMESTSDRVRERSLDSEARESPSK